MRKLRMPKARTRTLAPGGWLRFRQIQDLQLGPAIPRYMDTHEPICTAEADVAAHYEGLPFRGFATYAEMRRAWEIHGEDLMAESPGSWWAWQQWSMVTVSNFTGGEE
jgi:hypothetical protein